MTIKQTPEGFCVEEILTLEAQARIVEKPGLVAVYRLIKMRLTTPDAVAAVARALGVPVGVVSYAGLKDKHAHTSQHVGVAFPAGQDAPVAVEGPNWQITRLGWSDEPLMSSAIAVNRFGITVTGLLRKEVEQMDRSAELLAAPGAAKALRLVNYFGDQRFGSARHRRGFLAAHLVRGEFEQALKLAIATPARKDRREDKDFKRTVAGGWGKWGSLLKQLPRCPERAAVETLAAGGDFRDAFAALPYLNQWLAVEAYQSHLWNLTARRLIEQFCPQAECITAPDPFGAMLFPPAAATPAALVDLELPLLGRNSELREPWKAAAEAVLAEKGVTTSGLRIPGLRRPYFGEAPRRLFIDAGGFSMTAAKVEEASARPERFSRVLTFDLPRGSYATVLLRALGQ